MSTFFLTACMEDVVPNWDEEEPVQQDWMTDQQDDAADQQDEFDQEAMEDMMQQPDIPEPPQDTSVADEWHTVVVDYVWTTDEWEVFDTSKEDVAQDAGIYMERPYEPIEFVLWAGQMIPGFENAVIGMEEGDTKQISLSPDEGYWDYQEDHIDAIPMQEFDQAGIEPVEWEILDFGMAQWTVLEVHEEEVMVDFNHPMAGENMNFEITLHEIRAEEVDQQDMMPGMEDDM